MSEQVEQLAAIREIRDIMARSSRFLSLSGLSGVWAGSMALLGAAAAFWASDGRLFTNEPLISLGYGAEHWPIANNPKLPFGLNLLHFLWLDAVAVFLLALIGAFYFTFRRTQHTGHSIWDATAQRLTVNLCIPLAAGGIFCLAMIYHHVFVLVAPATLLFYGMAVLNASKYTLNDIRYLGILEIVLGLLAAFFSQYAIEFWAIGFGICHILYGLIMYYKYERKTA